MSKYLTSIIFVFLALSSFANADEEYYKSNTYQYCLKQIYFTERRILAEEAQGIDTQFLKGYREAFVEIQDIIKK